MKDLKHYLWWEGKRRLRTVRVFAVFWLAADLLLWALPQSACAWISLESSVLSLLLNGSMFLAGLALAWYPVFVAGASWFTPRRSLEQLTGGAVEKQILAGLLLNVPVVFLLYVQCRIGMGLMAKLARDGVSFFQIALSWPDFWRQALWEQAFFMPSLYLFFYLLFGRRGWKLLAYVAALGSASLLEFLLTWEMALPAAWLPWVTLAAEALLCGLLISACGRIARRRGY